MLLVTWTPWYTCKPFHARVTIGTELLQEMRQKPTLYTNGDWSRKQPCVRPRAQACQTSKSGSLLMDVSVLESDWSKVIPDER